MKLRCQGAGNADGPDVESALLVWLRARLSMAECSVSTF